MMTTRNSICALVILSALTGCGAEDKPGGSNATCDEINHSTYFSNTLQDGGATPDGTTAMHWQARFEDGNVELAQTDYILRGTYRCTEDVVTADFGSGDVLLNFSDDYDQLRISGEDVGYTRAEPLQSNACQWVRGNTYVPEAPTAIPPNVEFAPEFYEFSADNQDVVYTIGGDVIVRGIYECDLGVLHIHASRADDSPMIVTVLDKGDVIEVRDEDFMERMVKQSDVCTTEYNPVCAVKPEVLNCFTAPCPIGFHHTYSNQCQADSANAVTAFAGECGELEGQPAYDDPIGCTREYDPVCGAASSSAPCTELPCPALNHKTFGNACDANSVKAPILFDGECGDKEGEPVEQLSGGCVAVVDPVCAKVKTSVVCVTEPCPSHQYSSVNNLCEAQMQLAPVIFESQCGDLEDTLAFAQPPVKLVDGRLPGTMKSPRVMSAEVREDVLYVTLAYSGCDQQHFNLYVSTAFRESIPVQAEYAFIPLIEDACDAAWQTDYQFDLIPLKHAFEQSYPNSENKEINLPDLVNYRF